ncbi:MAG: hypothetical protein PVH99_03265 [Desulfobacteraceae bacterium]|jgi:hypothetical protein
MKAIRETNSQVVEWKGRWEYELRSNGDIIGILHFKENQVTRAVAESAEGSWRFRKKWFPFDKVILFQGDTDTEVGVLRTKLAGDKSSLEFPDGHLFYWKPTNVWRNKCTFTDAFGEHLLHFKRNSNPISVLAAPKGHSTGKVEITRFGFYMYELPLLLLLGCYLMVIDSI